MIIIPPHTLHGFQFANNTKGHVLTLSFSFVEQLWNGMSFNPSRDSTGWAEYNELRYISFVVESKEYNDLLFLIHWINQELVELNLHKKIVLQSCFQLLFIALDRKETTLRASLLNEQYAQKNQPSLHHYRAFQHNIRKSIHAPKSIRTYARELNLSTVHLQPHM